MKASDYIAKFLYKNGVKHIFGLQGGSVVHLFDSVEKTPDLSVIYCHHEQSAALAATSNAKFTGNIGAVIVTTGPGTTNALTGLLAAWQDSTPVFFISGQTRVEHTSYNKPVRQVGSQEFNILDIVRPITKYSTLITDGAQIPRIFEEAYYAATEGRKGPVWIDIPVNIQWEDFNIEEPIILLSRDNNINNSHKFDSLLQMIELSRQPVIVAGNGIRSSKSVDKFNEFIRKSNIPFVSTWTASDLSDHDDPLFGGIIGVSGQRGANKILYKADLIICMGTHLSLTHTSTMLDEFSPNSKKVIINIDQAELDNLNVNFDLKVHEDISLCLDYINNHYNDLNNERLDWITEFAKLKKLNSTLDTINDKFLTQDKDNNYINSNYFNYKLSRKVSNTDNFVIDGGGTALYTGFQSTFIHKGQRIICSSAISAMGTGLPESIGVSFGSLGATVYCIIGDGSLMLNLQELQTISYHKLPIKIIVYNNRGYLAIRHTQEAFLGSKYYGTDSKHGINFPDLNNVANCFNLDYLKVSNRDSVDNCIDKIIAHRGPILVEVSVSPNQKMLFQQGYKETPDGKFKPHNLSEMKPYL